MAARILFLKATIPGGAHRDLFAAPVQVAGHTTSAGTYVAPYTAVRRKAPHPDPAWAQAALAAEAHNWSPKVMAAARPMFRSVSPEAVQDLVQTGAVRGKGNGFAESHRKHVFFGDAITPGLLGQGEDLQRQFAYTPDGLRLQEHVTAAVAAQGTAKAALLAWDAQPGRRDPKARRPLVAAMDAAHTAEMQGGAAYRMAMNAWCNARVLDNFKRPWTSAVIETVPLGGGLHYSHAHGQTAMSGDEYGFPQGHVRAADVARVHLVKDRKVIGTTTLAALASQSASPAS